MHCKKFCVPYMYYLKNDIANGNIVMFQSAVQVWYTVSQIALSMYTCMQEHAAKIQKLTL